MKISIVTPNYNYEQFIGQTIESVVTQDYDNIEHIIVDDGSTDNSVVIIKDYQKRYPEKIKLIQQENKGQTNAINNALKNVTGDIINWINSDDTFCPNVFFEIMNIFKNNNSIDIIYGDVNVVDINGKFIYRKRHLDFNYLECCFSGFTSCFTSNGVFWRKSILLKNELLNEHLKCNMDGEYISRIVRGSKVYFYNKQLANFRLQKITITANRYNNWSEIVDKELQYELELSYNNLKIANLIPYRHSKLIRYFYRFKRIIKRLLSLHYFLEKMEKNHYYKTYQ